MPNAKLCQLVILSVIAGCTTQPGKDHLAAAEADVQCRSEQPTGTMLSTSICTTKAEREARQAAAEGVRAAAAQSDGCRPTTSAGGCQ
jgi:hypothetical protein